MMTPNAPLKPSASSPVVLAHISDVHLPPPSPLPGWRSFCNKRLLSLASWKRHRSHRHLRTLSDEILGDIARLHPDLILNTGDLTNFGLTEEFQQGAAWLRRLPRPGLIVPGNHDAMVGQSWQDGAGLWSEWMERCGEDDFPYCRRFGEIAVIGVNSAVSTPPFMACGRVGAEQRARLARLLDETRSLCRIVMIHHPPRRGLVPWRKSLLDHRRTAGVIARHGAALVLHGHSHDGTIAAIPGSAIPLVGVASASLRSSRSWRQAGWNRIAVRRDIGGSWEIDLDQRCFSPDDGWHILRRRHWSIRAEI